MKWLSIDRITFSFIEHITKVHHTDQQLLKESSFSCYKTSFKRFSSNLYYTFGRCEFLQTEAAAKSPIPNHCHTFRKNDFPEFITVAESIIPNDLQAFRQVCPFQSVTAIKSPIRNAVYSFRQYGLSQPITVFKDLFFNAFQPFGQNDLLQTAMGKSLIPYTFNAFRQRDISQPTAITKCFSINLTNRA